MCNIVCICCEKDICKCPNVKDTGKEIVNAYLQACNIPSRNYEITRSSNESGYTVLINSGWWIVVTKDTFKNFPQIESIDSIYSSHRSKMLVEIKICVT